MKKNQKISLLFLTILSISFFIINIQPNILYNEKLSEREKKVAAFYYGWYSNSTDYSQIEPILVEDDDQWRHWNLPERGWYPPTNACTVNTPIFGYYDSADPYVIEQHLLMAEWAGIDAFVCSFWGYNGFEYDNFKTMLNVSKLINSNVSLSLYFEIDLGGIPILPENEATELMIDQFREIYALFTDTEYSDYIWFEDEKPVLFTYVAQFASAQVWTNVINSLKGEGIEFFLSADRPGSTSEYNKNFQANHQYDCYAPTKYGTYFSDILNLKKSAKEFGQVFAAPVSPGYNDTVVRDGNEPLLRHDDQTYEQSWKNALSLNPDWITITSWNEWHEGTEIQPSIEDGDLALNQTKTFIEEFKSDNLAILERSSFYSSTYNNNFVIGIAISWILAIGLIFLQNLKNNGYQCKNNG